mmetsp:Transcript_54124/g.139816  ORF Transcript_54124/g.139816 Transcript_54124/m.139816 type:complete len:339 (-) Transcript_54124:353-1369(-)
MCTIAHRAGTGVSLAVGRSVHAVHATVGSLRTHGVRRHHHLMAHVAAYKLLERGDELGARHAEEFNVAAANVLAVARHRAFAIVLRGELNVGLARRLLTLIEHQVHAVERHRQPREEVEDVITRDLVWQATHLHDCVGARHTADAADEAHLRRHAVGREAVGRVHAVLRRHRAVMPVHRRVHPRRQVVRLANALHCHRHLLRRRAENFHVPSADGAAVLCEGGVGHLFGSELDERLAIRPAVRPEDQVHTVRALGDVVALEEGENEVSRSVERQATQPHDAIGADVADAHLPWRTCWRRWHHVGLAHLALAREEHLNIPRTHVAVVECLHSPLGRHLR